MLKRVEKRKIKLGKDVTVQLCKCIYLTGVKGNNRFCFASSIFSKANNSLCETNEAGIKAGNERI